MEDLLQEIVSSPSLRVYFDDYKLGLAEEDYCITSDVMDNLQHKFGITDEERDELQDLLGDYIENL